MKVVFVCTGNTCRSPMAEKIAQKWLSEHLSAAAEITISSAGIAAFPGGGASEQSIQVMAEFGLDLSGHTARQIDRQTVDEADLILTMTAGHKLAVLQRYFGAGGKVYTLAEFVYGDVREIDDPYGQSVEVYRRAAHKLQELIAEALHKIVTRT